MHKGKKTLASLLLWKSLTVLNGPGALLGSPFTFLSAYPPFPSEFFAGIKMRHLFCF